MSQQPIRIWADSFRAAAIHLSVSLLIVGALALLVFKVWYPTPLAAATGVLAIFAMVFVVDLLIGPLLTLVVYKKNKKSLVFDLTVIVLIQITALSYGIYSLSQARPVWLAFYSNRFEIVRLNDIEDIYLKDAPKEYAHASLTGPKWVATRLIGSSQEIEDLEFGNKLGAKIVHQPALYYPIEQAYPEIVIKAYDLSKLEAANSKEEIDKYLSVNPKATGWLPLWGQQQHMVVLLNKDAVPLNIVNLRPWTTEQMNTVLTSAL
ncbi:TfpX/TfpZ family type IV pilin accessory protein [Psychrobacter sp. LFX-11D]|uniref:TfpX/TfpZ family type IV pilin accessory protein n=1 Tax=Psychrobacter sp. LFX-11D TaxID=458201 RepID=UPI00191A7426|nr:TfpX/TfpZ family type IV pilin accessory protein [Psychrobacter sp. LFX-11D]